MKCGAHDGTSVDVVPPALTDWKGTATVARHAAPRRRWFSRLAGPTTAQVDPTGPLPAVPAATDSTERVILEETPAQPHEVRLDYPDGSRLRAGWDYAGPAGGQENYIVRVPSTARLVNGMIVRADRDLTLTVAVHDHPLRFPYRGEHAR